jgi:hypothetical protein
MTLARLAVLVLALHLALASRADAYLDAGSGSMLIQLLFGGTAGLVVLVKLYWRRVLSLFGRGDAAANAVSEVDAKPGD